MLAEIVDARPGRRRAARIDRFDLAVFFRKDQRKKIAAGPTGFGLHHSNHKRSRERGINGVAPFLENSDSGQGSQAVTRRNQSVPAHDDRARRFVEVHAAPNPRMPAALPPRILSFSAWL